MNQKHPGRVGPWADEIRAEGVSGSESGRNTLGERIPRRKERTDRGYEAQPAI